MFLVNSRTPLVIATCGLFTCRHPLYLRYRASLPSSLDSVTLRRLGLHSQGHLSRFLVRTHKIHSVSFFIDSRPRPKIAPIFAFNLFLAIMALQRFMAIKHEDYRAWLSPKCQKTDYRCRKRICVVQEYEPVSLLP